MPLADEMKSARNGITLPSPLPSILLTNYLFHLACLLKKASIPFIEAQFEILAENGRYWKSTTGRVRAFAEFRTSRSTTPPPLNAHIRTYRPPQAIKRATSISTSGRVVFLAHGNVSGSCSILFTNAVTSRSAY
ncbi:hypothetical protein SERLA73DRAFT_78199 [Serpula lacrymans var. lacrymans S7.3]|uniref:Uncharacterized protein n=1 Tax=Serpula lacrymans var. lacrymans (strain S7.3) TaxID=936435 RepID=F8QCF7_SERL3|nr:hypothetical protein SERLA73DRAFT_78199 [Serpula lacrymans var. lacrymans S7.3]